MSPVPFDPRVPDPTLGQDGLSNLLRTVADNVARDVRVCMPARVERVRGNQLVDLQPLLQPQYVAATGPTTLRPVANCPVSMAAGADYYVRLPVAVGDLGLLLVSDRALDAWLAGDGAPADPGHSRCHNLTDAIFIPGLYPIRHQIPEAGNDDLVLKNGQAELRLEKAGRVRINNDGQELVEMVSRLTGDLITLVQSLQAAQVLTMTGPAGYWSVTQQQLAQLSAGLQQLQQDIGTIQG